VDIGNVMLSYVLDWMGSGYSTVATHVWLCLLQSLNWWI